MRFEDLRGLKYAVYQKLSSLEEGRKLVVDAVRRLNQDHPPSATLMEAAVACHLRPTGRRKNDCALCLADKLFENYESRLFAMSRMNAFEDEEIFYAALDDCVGSRHNLVTR